MNRNDFQNFILFSTSLGIPWPGVEYSIIFNVNVVGGEIQRKIWLQVYVQYASRPQVVISVASGCGLVQTVETKQGFGAYLTPAMPDSFKSSQ